jgi:NAD(P)-dependent dehydrogenase (short-subunit alcohol dehydrogenase family)|tara:strand:- start:1295 stop:2008 length:714 start_codon:yes stop_codon:yes gene_type:complete
VKTNTLILGSSSGIGFFACKYFLKKGHCVVGVSRKLTKIKSKKFQHISFDLNNFDEYEVLFKKIYKKFGKIQNILFSAGVQFLIPTSIISGKHIDKILNINLKFPLMFAKFISNKKYFKRPGSVVFISSAIATRPSSGQSIYSSSKSGINNLVKTLALEVSKYKITVNSVSPGMIKSPMLSKYSEYITKDFFDKVTNQHPLGLGKFEDVVNAIDFLFKKESKWITGINLMVDGGYNI